MLAISLGADHAGWELKEALKAWLIDQGHEVLDFGTHGPESVDYPDYAVQVAESVAAGKVSRGLLVCGTGIGMAITANKVSGVRAAVAADVFGARMCREHNDVNVLCLGARVTDQSLALDILRMWLATEFAGGRHARRVDKIGLVERLRVEDGAGGPGWPGGDGASGPR
jgi:ribose 5-phosphate isomerase B